MDLLNKKSFPVDIPLPPEIIHRIQFFLNGKEAARTTILSKSWCSAWHTRPNLDFDQQDFRNRGDEFSKFTKKTIKRYADRNLTVRSWKLYMKPQWSSCEFSNYDDRSLATELIVEALKLGAINFRIDFQAEFLLPDELLRSQTLARLSVSGVTVDLRRRNGEDLNCSYPHLKSLILASVRVSGDLIRDLNSRWPLIEELTLQHPCHLDNPVMLGEFQKLEFRKLKYLCLRHCRYVKLIFLRCDAWAKYACLKELVIWDNNSYNGLRICSRSLECIRIRLLDNRIWNMELDVPNIRVFQYKGSPFSRFEFKETSCKGWESDIQITSPGCHIPCTWFSALNTFVKMLSLSSRVSVSMNVKIPPVESFDCYGRDGAVVAKPAAAMENLTLEGDAVSLAFVENVILSCRPKFIYIEEQDVQLVEELQVQPWMTLLDASTYNHKFVRFLLKEIGM